MGYDDYQLVLLAILRAHSDAALAALRAIDRDLPEKTRRIIIMVHPNQDPDGMFGVMVHLDGPDLHVLNRAIAAHRSLFDVRFVNGKPHPALPMFDPFDQPFGVNDAIVDTAMIWLGEVWASFGGTSRRVPVVVQGADGYGRKPVMPLTA